MPIMKIEILEAAEEAEADLIVVGSHRPAMKDYLLGTNASRVMRHARCSVLVARERGLADPAPQGASVQNSGLNVPKSGPRGRLFRQRQHPGCDVGCQDRAGRSDTLSRQERLLAGASGDVDDSMADVDSGQVKHPLSQRC